MSYMSFVVTAQEEEERNGKGMAVLKCIELGVALLLMSPLPITHHVPNLNSREAGMHRILTDCKAV